MVMSLSRGRRKRIEEIHSELGCSLDKDGRDQDRVQKALELWGVT